ncbi:rRNA-processing protein UTP23 homolog [Phymastichus coffea]|uniref:rRNA-processing protein UTP23 homolog n=1 Tax=Phymastichus coffea TaxID=108790 RepID=UPI00273C3403|nr:rRNA-processing protein UTP23 homolog [Phymastichus coffea]
MKIQRLKKVQKNIGFYVNNFKFRQPYQILIDGTFSFAALENKFNIHEQLSKYFQSQVKLLTTQCVILETEKLGPKLYGAMLIVKQFAIHKCGHEKQPLTGSKCLHSMVGSNNFARYIVATQDRLLQEQLRNIPGVPIIYLHGKAPTLEPPSTVSRKYAEELRSHAIMTGLQEKTIETLKKQTGLNTEVTVNRKKRKTKGNPNPLSIKKSKKIKDSLSKCTNKHKVDKTAKVRKRKRIKIPAHIKEVFKGAI